MEKNKEIKELISSKKLNGAKTESYAYKLGSSICKSEIFPKPAKLPQVDSLILNFEANQTLTLSKIVEFVFLNLDRTKYPQAELFKGFFDLYSQIDKQDIILERITEIKKLEEDFNKASIKPYDVTRLYDKVDKNQWVADLKKSKWYGPFKFAEHQYRLVTVTDSGKFQGLSVDIFTAETKGIYVNFHGPNGEECADPIKFEFDS